MHKSTKIAFIHGRPDAHPRNRKFAESIDADFHWVDQYLPYAEHNSGRIRRYLSWIINALFFPKRTGYTIFLTEGLHLPQPLMKYLGLIGSNQKLVGLMVGEELYFLYSRYYNRLTSWIMKRALEQYDLLLCKGQMQAFLAREILGKKCPVLRPIINGIPKEKLEALLKVQPAIHSHNIVLLANGPGGFRVWYKGLDLMVKVVDEVSKLIPDISFTIVGNWNDSEICNMKASLSNLDKQHLIFLPPVSNVDKIAHLLSNFSVFFLISRGDCFPNATLEAMAAGLVPIISEWTGTKEVVAKVNENLILPLEKDKIVSGLLWFFDLSVEKKESLSQRSKEAVSIYKEETAIQLFQKALFE